VNTTDTGTTIEETAAMLLETDIQEDEAVQTDDEVEAETADEQTDDTDQSEAEPEGEADTDDDAEEAEADEKPDDLITVKVDGKEVAVTLDELKRAYSGNKYIQEGMQKAAAARKEVEGLYHTLQTEREQVASFYQKMMQGQIAQPPQAPNPAMINEDPIGYMAEKAQYDQALAQFQAQQQQFQAIQGQQSAAQAAAQKAYLQEQVKLLTEAIPEFADPAKSDAIKRGFVETAQEFGYSAEEIAQVTDHRALRVLHDAMQYRKLQQSKPRAIEKASNARPVLKPKAAGGMSKQAAADKARARAKATGSVDDVAALLLT
jgi:hypothetical protein